MKSNKSQSNRPPFEKWYSTVLLLLVGYCIADLGILYARQYMLPKGAAVSKPKNLSPGPTLTRSMLSSASNRNIFAKDGTIPTILALVGKDPNAVGADEIPEPSSLPMTLIGTLVHSNPQKSIAAIEVKGKNSTLSYAPGKDIQGLATLVGVERQRIIFRNLNNSRLEFIEMKKDGSKISIGGAPKASGKVVERSGDTFNIKRSDLLKYTNNLQSVLMQARAVPNTDANGNINGFRLMDMQAGSIFEQLGLQRMDVIKSVDGSVIDSLPKAMELYNSLKNNPKLNLGIERNGKTENFNYQINN